LGKITICANRAPAQGFFGPEAKISRVKRPLAGERRDDGACAVLKQPRT
jgi:hypothetical protein